MSLSATVLIADSHDITRASLRPFLMSIDCKVLEARDGGEAIATIQSTTVDLIIFDHVMTPIDGFELMRYIQGSNQKIPCILMTENRTSDLLSYAGSMGIQHIVGKPVDTQRIKKMVEQIMTRRGHQKVIASQVIQNDPVPMSPEQLMEHVLKLARKNADDNLGGPFASVVADPKGYMIGSGVNLHSSRFNPIAHAEVMAILKATEKLQQSHLEGCSIYSTSEPTQIAKALIQSVGITKIYYGLSHAEINELKAQEQKSDTIHTPRDHTETENIRLYTDQTRDMVRAALNKQS